MASLTLTPYDLVTSIPVSNSPDIGNLLFYSKNGNPINLKLVDGVWTGTIYLPEVSVGLFENETIYVVEKMFDTGISDFVYGQPHVPFMPFTNATGPNQWLAIMDPRQSDKINLFTVDNINEENPSIVFAGPETTFINGHDNSTDSFNSGTGYLEITDNVNQAMIINVCLMSDSEDAYRNTIYIFDGNGLIAKIDVYGETVGEDERFNVLLSNFGEQLLASDEFIFRTSDIDEQAPDYKLLNRKRKELFVEYNNIIPYLASYKGLINILKFFDYYDIQLKEYWFNPDTGKRTARDIQINDYSKLSTPPEIPKAPYQKTCKFGLFYEMNQPTGEYDENGLPIMEWSDNYSPEEVLIKLFGLRNYIYRRNIGGISQITDIVGQAYYYAGSNLRGWKDQSEMLMVNRNICPTFTTEQTSGYIQDIRSIINVYSCNVPRGITSIISGGSYPVWGFSGCWISYFDGVDDDSPPLAVDDQEENPIGFPVTLTNTSFDVTWAECDTHWVDTLNITVPVHWNTIGAQNYYDAEWIVSYKPDVTTDTRSFTADVRGSITDMAVQQFMLPYAGSYSVTLILYGYNGVYSKHTEIGFINVKLKQPDFATFYKIFDQRVQFWGTCQLPWNSLINDWNKTVYDTVDFPPSESPIYQRSFSPVPYRPLTYDYPGDLRIGYREINWNTFNNPWTDAEFVTWEQMTPIYGKPAHFKITEFVPGTKIQVGRSFITVPIGFNIADYFALAALMNAADLPDMNTFLYTARPFAHPYYIDCVSNLDGVSGNMLVGNDDTVLSVVADDVYDTWAGTPLAWKDIPIVWSAATYIYGAKGIDEPFTYQNTRYAVGHFDAPILVPIAFTYDNSGMSGKESTHWIITVTDTNELVADIVAPRMMFRFTEIGNYNISCTITDIEGNQATVSRTSCVSIINPAEWKRHHPY